MRPDWADERLSTLSPDELDRAGRLRRREDRERFATAWTLVRHRLSEITGVPGAELEFVRDCRVCGDPRHGKPRLRGPGPSFSLSHSGDRVVVAVSEDSEVGVDVEAESTRPIDDLADRILHAEEAPASGLELLRTWVRKEAILKASGHGLGTAMTSIHLGALPVGTRFEDLDAGAGYLAAVAEIAPG